MDQHDRVVFTDVEVLAPGRCSSSTCSTNLVPGVAGTGSYAGVDGLA
jgi:hypothetical protein